MKQFYIEESGYYKISTNIEAVDEEDAVNKLYGSLPNFINIDAIDREIEEIDNE